MLNPWRRYSCRSTPGQLDSANAFAFSILQPYQRDFIGQPVAPLLTAGAKEFAPRRVIELADSIQREGHFEKHYICCTPIRWTVLDWNSDDICPRYIFAIGHCRQHCGRDYGSTVGATTQGYPLNQ